MKKAYKYYTGETVWSLDGESWFITDDAKDTTKPTERPIKSKIALDISKI